MNEKAQVSIHRKRTPKKTEFDENDKIQKRIEREREEWWTTTTTTKTRTEWPLNEMTILHIIQSMDETKIAVIERVTGPAERRSARAHTTYIK